MRTIQFIIICFLLPLLFLACSTQTEEKLLKQAKKIHAQIITVDTHVDTPLMFDREGYDFSGKNPKSNGKVNLKKMQDGGLDAVFLAVFIGQDERTPEKYSEANATVLNIFESIHSLVNSNSDLAALALTSDDVYRLKNEKRRAIYIGIENGYPIGLNVSLLDDYYKLGARYLTLCHTRNNDICDSSTDPSGEEHGGLSAFGREVVVALNRLGMLIDVSHISDNAFFQVLELSKAPVLASHSNARAVCNNPRNLTDNMLRLIAQNGGVVQVCLLSSYVKATESSPARDSAQNELRKKYNNFQNLSPEERKDAVGQWYAIDEKFPPTLANVSDLVDHIDHIVKVAGIEHVGIGSDFDGGGAIEGCIDASQMMNITVELLKRGYSNKDIEKIWGLNFLRVFRQVEEYSKGLN